MTLEELYSALCSAMPGRVFYGSNAYDSGGNAPPPYAVYQEVSGRARLYADDSPVYRSSSVQITLVTRNKDPAAERALEAALTRNGLRFSLLSESVDPDECVSRVYETELEEI